MLFHSQVKNYTTILSLNPEPSPPERGHHTGWKNPAVEGAEEGHKWLWIHEKSKNEETRIFSPVLMSFFFYLLYRSGLQSNFFKRVKSKQLCLVARFGLVMGRQPQCTAPRAGRLKTQPSLPKPQYRGTGQRIISVRNPTLTAERRYIGHYYLASAFCLFVKLIPCEIVEVCVWPCPGGPQGESEDSCAKMKNSFITS